MLMLLKNLSLCTHCQQVREQVEYFRDYLGNITGAIVNVDDFRVHENHDGTVDKTKTDLYLHLVDRRDNSVLEVKQVLAMIDKNVEHLDHLFKVGNVFQHYWFPMNVWHCDWLWD